MSLEEFEYRSLQVHTNSLIMDVEEIQRGAFRESGIFTIMCFIYRNFPQIRRLLPTESHTDDFLERIASQSSASLWDESYIILYNVYQLQTGIYNELKLAL
jgi:hypothetical protein